MIYYHEPDGQLALLELGCPARVYIPLEEVSRLESLPGEGPEWCAVLPRETRRPRRGGKLRLNRYPNWLRSRTCT